MTRGHPDPLCSGVTTKPPILAMAEELLRDMQQSVEAEELHRQVGSCYTCGSRRHYRHHEGEHMEEHHAHDHKHAEYDGHQHYMQGDGEEHRHIEHQHMHEHPLEFHDDPDRVDSTWILWIYINPNLY